MQLVPYISALNGGALRHLWVKSLLSLQRGAKMTKERRSLQRIIIFMLIGISLVISSLVWADNHVEKVVLKIEGMT